MQIKDALKILTENALAFNQIVSYDQTKALATLISFAEQSQEIRNWPEPKDPSSHACTDPIFECIGWNKALSLCASVVRGNMMTVEEILYQMIKVADLMPYEPYPQTKEAIVYNQAYIKAKEISEAIHQSQLKKMFGEGKNV